jgi:hypothetical protein
MKHDKACLLKKAVIFLLPKYIKEISLGIFLNAFAYANVGLQKVNADFQNAPIGTSPFPCTCFSVVFD